MREHHDDSASFKPVYVVGEENEEYEKIMHDYLNKSDALDKTADDLFFLSSIVMICNLVILYFAWNSLAPRGLFSWLTLGLGLINLSIFFLAWVVKIRAKRALDKYFKLLRQF